MINECSSNYLISIDEACDELQCGKTTVYNLLRSNELQGFRINRRWKIPKEALGKFIIAQSNNNTCKPKK